MHGTYVKSFSIRSLLFVTFVVGAFVAALRDPSDAMVLCIVATLITSVASAWYVTLRDWPDGNCWLLAFAIAATLLALDLYLVPSGWRNSAFAIVHPQDAAEHARSPLSGLNKESVAFGYIFEDGIVMLLAAVTAALVSPLRPQRIPLSLICGWIAMASACLFLVFDAIAFAVSVVNCMVLTAAWFSVLRNLAKKYPVLIAFTLGASCFMLFTGTRMVPELNLYETLHARPASLPELHHERYVFQAIHRDCMAIWFGGIASLVVALSVWARPKSQDRLSKR